MTRKASSLALNVGAAATAVLATLVLAQAASAAPQTSWLTYGFDSQRTGYNPGETTLGTSNVPGLHQLWSRYLGAAMIAQPVEAASVKVGTGLMNVVYEGTWHGQFYAIRSGNGQIIWHNKLGAIETGCLDSPDTIFGIGGARAISFTAPGVGVIYVAGGDGAVHALDLATGNEEPGWPVHGVFTPSTETVYSGLNLVSRELYVTTASYCDFAPYYSGATEIDVGTRKIISRFYPAGPPSGGISGGGIWGPGGVSVDPSNGEVYAATGNALTIPENYRYSDAVVELTSALHVVMKATPNLTGGDVDFGTTPILFRPSGCPLTLVAAKNKSGVLLVYAEDQLNKAPRQRFQMAEVTDSQFNGVPAWDPVTNMLYIGNSSDSSNGTFTHGMVALKAAADCSLSLAWGKGRRPEPHKRLAAHGRERRRLLWRWIWQTPNTRSTPPPASNCGRATRRSAATSTPRRWSQTASCSFPPGTASCTHSARSG